MKSSISHFLCFFKCQAISDILHNLRIYGCIRSPQHERNNWSVLGIIASTPVQKKDINVSVNNLPTRFFLQGNYDLNEQKISEDMKRGNR